MYMLQHTHHHANRPISLRASLRQHKTKITADCTAT